MISIVALSIALFAHKYGSNKFNKNVNQQRNSYEIFNG